MGGGNGQKSAMARAKKLELEKKKGAGAAARARSARARAPRGAARDGPGSRAQLAPAGPACAPDGQLTAIRARAATAPLQAAS
jgi:hypothetical protein